MPPTTTLSSLERLLASSMATFSRDSRTLERNLNPEHLPNQIENLVQLLKNIKAADVGLDHSPTIMESASGKQTKVKRDATPKKF